MRSSSFFQENSIFMHSWYLAHSQVNTTMESTRIAQDILGNQNIRKAAVFSGKLVAGLGFMLV